MTRLAALLAALLVSSCSTASTLTGAGRPPNSKAGAWRELPPAPDGVNPWATGVWTGQVLILWSSPGAIYDPEADSWRKLPSPPRGRALGGGPVWSGKEVLSWSRAKSRSDKPTNDGIAFDPATNGWRSLPRAPISGRVGHESVWTGSEMIVWGGMEQCCAIDSTIHAPEAAAFDPAADRWRRMRDAAIISGDGAAATTLVNDDRMLVWRGQHLSAYEIERDRWSRLSNPVFPRELCGMTGGPASAATIVADTIYTWSGSCETKWGRASDLETDRWRRTADAPIDIWSLVAGNNSVYASGRSDPMVDRASIWRYDTHRDRWSELPKPSQPFAAGAFVTWTGSEVLVWGGQLAKGIPPTGAAYTPR